jgi:hypothetical protein
MRYLFSLLVLPLLVLLLSGDASAQFYNGSQMTFGKNRVQYNGFTWMSQNYERFKIYYTMGGKNHSLYIAQAAHKHLADIEKMFEFQLEEKIEFVVYNSQSQFRQSNIGLNGDEMYNIGGVTRIAGSKVFLFYEGDHKKLEAQIRGGIAYVLLNNYMYGSNWRDVLKNSTLMTLPDWFQHGFVSWVSEPWSVETEGYVKDGVMSGKYNRFYRTEGLDAKYAGHAMWNYIAEVYGMQQIPNILYMTRISRSVENGFLYVLGASFRTLSVDYIAYYRKRFAADDMNLGKISLEAYPVKTKKTVVYYQYKINPTGRYIAYVSNEMGQYKIWLHDLQTNKRKRILKGEQKLNRLNDYSYPVLGWHPSGNALAIAVEKKGELYFTIYALDDESMTKKVIGKLDKILSFDYSSDGKSVVLSGVSDGQTDLYLLKPTTGALEQLTNDIYDDLHPKFVHKDQGVIFSSNRESDTIGRNPKVKPSNLNRDIFVYDVQKRNRFLKRITQTPNVDETSPSQLDTLNYTFLSDENGVINRYAGLYDSTIAYIDTAVHYKYFTRTTPLTNYNTNILEIDLVEKTGQYGMLVLLEGKYTFLYGTVKKDVPLNTALQETQYRYNQRMALAKQQQQNAPKDSVGKKDNVVKPENPLQEMVPDSGMIDIMHYRFEDDIKPSYEKEVVKVEQKTDPVQKKDSVNKKKQIAEEFKPAPYYQYRMNFATDMIVSQLDNSYLNQTYQRYIPGAGYFNPGINALMKVGATDVFEDHRIVGGFRLAGNFGSNELMLMYQDNSKRMDKHYIVYRQSFNNYSRDRGVTKNQINDFKFMMRYPFNEVLSLRGSINYRNDKIVTLNTESSNLDKQNTYYHQAGSKLELVFDNTIPKGINLYNGMRWKVWGEYFREFITEQSNFIVAGFDFRYYQKIHRDFIWAGRVAGSASLGDKRLVYYLGGVDNWIAPNFDYSIQVAQDQNYAYQTIATPVRGFYQNARNGSNMVVINSEFRFPVFKYFAERPLRSDFLETFQIIGFTDAGTAFTGSSPYASDNSFNTIVYFNSGSPIQITILNQREPIIWGYGWGLRARIFGYFLRFDWAVGVDDGVRLKPLKYFSLSLDF